MTEMRRSQVKFLSVVLLLLTCSAILRYSPSNEDRKIKPNVAVMSSHKFSPLPPTFVMWPFSVFELVSLTLSDQVVPLC
jgi:hypothetical protein